MRAAVYAFFLISLFISACTPQAPAPNATEASVAGQLSGWNAVILPFLPTAINDAGVIVGSQDDRAVRYEQGRLTILPSLLGPPSFARQAVDITENGLILGRDTPFPQIPALFWIPPDFHLEVLEQPSVGSFLPVAMNDSRTVAGTSEDAEIAFKWTPAGKYTLLPPPEGWDKITFATDINEAGYITGYGTFSQGFSGAGLLLWTPDNDVREVKQFSFGTLRGGPFILNNGNVVWSQGEQLWSKSLDGAPLSPGVVPGMLTFDGVSERGRFVGTALSTGVARGWTYDGGAVYWLDPPNARPGDYLQPTGVNSCGNIIGVVYRKDGTREGVLFTKRLLCDVPEVLNQP